MKPITREDALAYHRLSEKPGKLAVVPTKPLNDQHDLGLAYTPGVAYPVLDIANDPNMAYEYTSKGNLVAVISNGTAILGLGDKGALASKPVMEGKAVLFKKFADIDVFDIEVSTRDPDQFIEIVASIAPTFGGINLEDIRSPECFPIERGLQQRLDIPVFHDDQHGTAIILAAGLMNALHLVNKPQDQVKIVFSGGGAAGVACAAHLVQIGIPLENIWMCDRYGLVYLGRKEEMFAEKEIFARTCCGPASLAETMEGADVFIGLSSANVVTPAMLTRMRRDPIVFAMANPDPEIPYDLARAARPDAIVATGRSDYPNQVNNVLGFPFIFRGALDVRARAINAEMKIAASRALAELTREPIPPVVLRAYGLDHLEFGRDYIVPKPLDQRVCHWEAPAVAQAAIASGIARKIIDIARYRDCLEERCPCETGKLD
jgi:malate dehydrogenase (oxaloacetate-decarboxylating)(NADP+)